MVPPEVVNFVRNVVDQIINPFIAILFAGALVVFMYGLLVFILNAGDPGKRDEGKKHLFWGLIGMTIMVSAFVIMEVALATFGISAGSGPGQYPMQVPI